MSADDVVKWPVTKKVHIIILTVNSVKYNISMI